MFVLDVAKAFGYWNILPALFLPFVYPPPSALLTPRKISDTVVSGFSLFFLNFSTAGQYISICSRRRVFYIFVDLATQLRLSDIALENAKPPPH